MKSFWSWFFLSFFAWLFTACNNFAPAPGNSAGVLSPTIYYRPVIRSTAQECGTENRHEVLTPEGKSLLQLCEPSFQACLREGSCLIIQGDRKVSLGYGGRHHGEATFVEVPRENCPYGRGADDDVCLDPYFSVAADLSVYHLGDVIYVPALRGLRLPDGEIHDGYLVVRDEGGGVKGPGRFDFFTGYLSHLSRENSLARLGFGDPDQHFDFQRVSGDRARQIRERRAYPGLTAAIRAQGLRDEP